MQMSHYTNTAFVSVMGDMDVTAISTTFQTYFPCLLLPIILLTLFDVYTRILNLFHIKRFQFNDDFNHDLIGEGESIIRGCKQQYDRTGTINFDTNTSLVSFVDNESRHTKNSPAMQFIKENQETVRLTLYFKLFFFINFSFKRLKIWNPNHLSSPR